MPKVTGVCNAVRVWLSAVGTSVLIGAAGAGCSDGSVDGARDHDPAHGAAEPGTGRRSTS